LVLAISSATVILLGVVAYAYDNSRDGLIAHGVSVAGVDVGGLRESAARARLEQRVTPKLDRPVRVAVAGRRYELTSKAASLGVDVSGMVDEAVGRSRTGGIPGRVGEASRDRTCTPTFLPA
jgi:hypothetical protein